MACLAFEEPAIIVQVTDAETGDRFDTPPSGFVQHGDFPDSLRPRTGGLPGDMQAAFERPGVYLVVVRRDGFREWGRDGVRARPGACGVISVSVQAQLEPL